MMVKRILDQFHAPALNRRRPAPLSPGFAVGFSRYERANADLSPRSDLCLTRSRSRTPSRSDRYSEWKRTLAGSDGGGSEH
jgi:hypothetical protein